MITSNQNPKLKLVRSLLGRPKERREAGAFVAEGVRLLEEAARSVWPVRFVLYSSGLSPRGQAVMEQYKSAGVDVEEISSDLLQSLSETENSQGILAVLQDHELPAPEKTDFALVPDQIRDPGNLGTLLRSASAAGVGTVLIPPATVDAFGPKVIRSAMGAHFRLPIRVMSWPDIVKFIDSAGMRSFLADMEGEACWNMDLRPPLALIIGSEADGASQDALELAQHRIAIPMPGRSESLNAGVAGSILMFEVIRQRSGL